ncbi:hypothetical protein M2322_003661 [Rhodoblastus acidophilus]|nr:hypothetical protein [Rhodoblastus acidophilus]MCW2318094.1 hypothetical protein [Rhodoblastus acidophilus]
MKQLRRFMGVAFEQLDVIGDVCALMHLQATVDAAHECAGFVATEIMARLADQQGANGGARTFGDGLLLAFFAPRRQIACSIRRLKDFGQPVRHGTNGYGEIHHAARYGAVRHAREVRTARIPCLGQGEAAGFLDRLDAEHAIVAVARQHDANRIIPPITRQRSKKSVDRRAFVVQGVSDVKLQGSAGYGERRIWRQDIDVVFLNDQAILRDGDAHVGQARQYFREKAVLVRRQMHQNNERHPRRRRHGFEKTLQRPQAPG